MDTTKKTTDSNSKRFIGYLLKEKKKISFGILFTISMGLVEILTGTLLKLITDSIEKYVSNSDGTVPLKLTLPVLKQKLTIIKTVLDGKEEIFIGLLMVGLAYLIFSFFQLLFEYFREIYMQSAAQRILQNFKSDIYCKVLRLPYMFYFKNKTGDIISRITYDVTTMTDIINLFIELSRSFIYLIVLLPVMFFIDWKITIAIVFFFPLSFVLINLVIKRIEIVSKGITDNVGDYTAFLDEKINNFRLVKIFGQEEREKRDFENLIEENYKLNLRNIKLISFLKPSNQFLGIVGLVLVFIFFDYKMVFSTESVGNAVFYLYILSQAFKPIKKLAREVGQLQVAAVSIKKIFRFLDSEEEVDSTDNPKNEEADLIEKIAFNNVGFGYDKDKSVIKNVSFELNAWETTAITGKSGSGKTTLVKLLARFFTYQTGAILINHLDLKNLRHKYLRRKIVIVNQHTGVFGGTIADNIFYGSGKIEEKKLDTLMRILSIDNLEQKVEVLSDGQKKIISIFRALLFKPQILVLDEIFEAIDKNVIDELFNLMSDIPHKLIITRQDSIIKKANKIICLENGEIDKSNSRL